MGVEGVGPKLRPKESTSNSCGDGLEGRKVLHGFIAQTCVQYLRDLTFCVHEISSSRKGLFKLRLEYYCLKCVGVVSLLAFLYISEREKGWLRRGL